METVTLKLDRRHVQQLRERSKAPGRSRRQSFGSSSISISAARRRPCTICRATSLASYELAGGAERPVIVPARQAVGASARRTATFVRGLEGAALEVDADTDLRVDVATPIDVVLFSMTASVRPEDGALSFADDFYGHDVSLARAFGR